MMATVKLKVFENVMEITLFRPEVKNAINQELLQDIHAALDLAEKDSNIRTILLKGDEKFFCIGMDFKETMTSANEKKFATAYAKTLKRFASIPKTIVSICEGKVMAGGLGFVAASDIVIAKPSAEFTLSEIMWGLLPANVMPYLIRRTGFQPAYFLTLTAKNTSAAEAKEIHLVDIVSEDPQMDFNKLNQRLSIIQPETMTHFKNYFRQMWIINESMEQLAIDTLTQLKRQPLVQNNIRNFVKNGKLPWD